MVPPFGRNTATWVSGTGWTVGYERFTGRTHGNSLDSPTYPTWESGIGWTVGYECEYGHMGIHWTVLLILQGTVE